MKICILFIFISIFSVSSPASVFAQGEHTSDDRYGLYLGIEGGSAIVPFPTVGGTVGAFLSPKLLLHVTYVSGDTKLDDIGIDWRYVEARAKTFVGESLFINAGIAQRYLEFDLTAESISDTANTVRLIRSAETMGLTLSFGNEWHWGSYHLGVDWLGVFVPVLRNSDNKVDSADANVNSREDLRDAADKYGEKPHLSALRVTAAYSF